MATGQGVIICTSVGNLTSVVTVKARHLWSILPAGH